MICPSQVPQTGPGSSQSTILIWLRQRLGDHLLGTHVQILIVHVVPPYVFSQGFPSHPPVRLAGQALAPFDRGTVLPIKTLLSERGPRFQTPSSGLFLLPCAAPALVRGQRDERDTCLPQNHQRSGAFPPVKPSGGRASSHGLIPSESTGEKRSGM